MAQIKSKIADYSGFVLLGVIWGLAFVAIKQADTELSPVNLALIRWFVTSAVFSSVRLAPDRKDTVSRYPPQAIRPIWLVESQGSRRARIEMPKSLCKLVSSIKKTA